MKKIFFFLAFCSMFYGAEAQFKIGPNVAVPVGVYSDFLAVSAGIDAYQMFGASEDAFLKFGFGASFINYFGQDYDLLGQTVDGEGIPMIPIAAAARLQVAGILTVGPDLGYAFLLKDGAEGGFYWRGVVGIDIADLLELNVFYHSVSPGTIDFYDESGGTLGSIGVGALFEF